MLCFLCFLCFAPRFCLDRNLPFLLGQGNIGGVSIPVLGDKEKTMFYEFGVAFESEVGCGLFVISPTKRILQVWIVRMMYVFCSQRFRRDANLLSSKCALLSEIRMLGMQ